MKYSTRTAQHTDFEVAFNHVLRGRGESGYDGDLVFFQGHASPGIYARAYLEGRISEEHLNNFRREVAFENGLSSYPQRVRLLFACFETKKHTDKYCDKS